MAVQESSSYFHETAFDMTEVPADLGDRVVEARQARRWSQARLAAKAQVSRATIYRLEAGGHAASSDTILRIARAFRRPIEEFVPDWWTKPTLDDRHIGMETRARRRELGLTLAQLAALAGVSEATLSRHERGLNVSWKLLAFDDGRLVPKNAALAKALYGETGSGERDRP